MKLCFILKSVIDRGMPEYLLSEGHTLNWSWITESLVALVQQSIRNSFAILAPPIIKTRMKYSVVIFTGEHNYINTVGMYVLWKARLMKGYVDSYERFALREGSLSN